MSGQESKPKDYGVVGVLSDDSSYDEIKNVFDEWALEYEKDTSSYGYIGHKTCTSIFDAMLDKHCPGTKTQLRILDAGAGTGYVGEHLKALGYSNVDALDISAEMLAIARQKNIYQDLICAAITEDKIVGIPCKHYDALICVGTFNVGHVKPGGMDEFLRIVKPGGIIGFTVIQEYYEKNHYGYKNKADELEKTQKWQLVHKELITNHTNNKERENSYVLAYRIAGQSS